MAYRSFDFALLTSLLLVPACFNPEGGDQDTDSEGDTGQTSEPTGAMTSMTMTGSDQTGDTTAGDDDDDDDDDTSGPECQGDGDCADMAGECEVATCNADGMCEVGNAAEGTACGDATDVECNAADTCDGNGTCVDNVTADGLDCSDCDSGQCICGSGTCDDCVMYADTNLFSTARSLNGWELTGDWGLYTEAPASQSQLDGMLYPAIPFGNQVLGTDGNRHGPAYPGGQMEFSYARTPPTELPTSLEFQSWHLDEGAGQYDNKIIRISTDGGKTWTDIISCVLDPMLPFCQFIDNRAADDWDSISLDLPAPLIGQIGIIEFAYDTFDSCCNFEKGWYIDVTNFATECACTADAVCGPYGSDCGEGVCGANGGCNIDPVGAGMACGGDDMNACTAPDTCDGFGYCQRNDTYPPFGGGPETQIVPCSFCDAGDDCVGCAGGACQDCANVPEVETFDFMNFPPNLEATFNWNFQAMSGGNWGVFFQISNNEENEGALSPSNAPFLGIDGSYVGPADGVGEVNNAIAVTRPDVFGDTLEFRSWHQDQGGASLDRKTIEISIDEGMNWITVVDCAGAGALSAFPFCNNVDNRDPEDWDDISIDIADYADMEGQVRFSYNTVTACCGFERGWYIDDLNFNQVCDAPNQSVFNAPCASWAEEEPCNANQNCAWDGAACIQCTNLDEVACGAEPLCEWRVGEGGGTLCAQAPA